MAQNTDAILAIASLLFLIAIRVPIAFALALVGAVGLFSIGGWRLSSNFIGNDLFSSVATFSLTAVPLFLLMGHFAYHAGLTQAAFGAAQIWFSRVRGGLAIATVVACAVFGAASGSGLAAAATLGRITIPEMLKFGYDKGLATGSVAASATLAVLIPPSVIMIIYAVFTEQSVGRLLMAGIIPGILSAALYMVMLYIRVRFKPELAPLPTQKYKPFEYFRALSDLWGIGLLFFIVVGGIYTGFVTASEAGALGALGALVLALASRGLTPAAFGESLLSTVRTTAMIFLLFIGAAIFARFIALTGAPRDLAAFVTSLDLPQIWFILALCLVFILMGMFFDSISMMLLTLPILLPVLIEMDVNLIWFGVIMVKVVEIGAITPPFGISIYVIKGVVGGEVSLEEMFKGISWFVVMDIVTLGLFIAFPQIVLWLPELMMGR